MTLMQINYIMMIAETKSINKAAERLFVSQPSLTKTVKEMEKELGITLFIRSGKGVTLTNDGVEFLQYAKQLYMQYQLILEKYKEGGNLKKKFGVSTQHYSFAVKAFVDMAKKFDMSKYEFAIRETRTSEVLYDVNTMRSEIGVLYLCDYNRKSFEKIFRTYHLEFHSLIECQAYVYVWKNHPLAKKSCVCFNDLINYPCLSFEQGDNSPLYFAEEILSTNEYARTIKTNDRASMLNLMIGLNGYTLCSGIICEELNGSDFVAVPFEEDEEHKNSTMEIGYITKKNIMLSHMGEEYIDALVRYLQNVAEN